MLHITEERVRAVELARVVRPTSTARHGERGVEGNTEARLKVGVKLLETLRDALLAKRALTVTGRNFELTWKVVRTEAGLVQRP